MVLIILKKREKGVYTEGSLEIIYSQNNRFIFNYLDFS